MTSAPNKRLRILVLWGAAMSENHNYLNDLLLGNPDHDFELVSGDRSRSRSPHAASWGRLLSLRRRLVRGEFDLVLSSSIQNTAWPRPKRFATCLAQALRFFTYKHRMLDSYWAPWLLAGLKGRVPFGVIDFLDTSYVLPKDYPLLKAATIYFKLNLYFWPRRSLMPLETLYSVRRVTPLVPKLHPLTHGVAHHSIPATSRPMRERDIDLCFTGSIVPVRSKGDVNPYPDLTLNSVRREIYERCLKLKDRYNVYCYNGIVPHEEYLDLLQRSKLMVCTESFGCETFRLYEAAAAGAVPLVNWPYAQNYMQLEPDLHAIYFSLIGTDFENTVARALADPAKLAEISERTRAFTIEHKKRQRVGEMVIRETLRLHAEAGL